MTLIEEGKVYNINYKFYNGIDFNLVNSHPKDGSNGLLYFFIESWKSEVTKWQREQKIENILCNTQKNSVNLLIQSALKLENDWICIYQTDGVKGMVDIVKSKLEEQIQMRILLSKTNKNQEN